MEVDCPSQNSKHTADIIFLNGSDRGCVVIYNAEHLRIVTILVSKVSPCRMDYGQRTVQV